MKLKLGIAAAVLFVVLVIGMGIAYGQAAHSVVLTWTASLTPNVTYNIYWAQLPTDTFIQVNTAPITGVTFTDTAHLSGVWEVDAVDANGDTSLFSNQATVPAAPSGCKAAAQ